MALLTSSFLNIPVVISVRGEPQAEYASGLMRFLARTYFAKAAGVVLQTKEAFSFFPDRIRKKAVILKNPLNPSFIRERGLRVRGNSVFMRWAVWMQIKTMK